jgi:UDP-N-acetylglucosamine:LPS N-acetylglucosamine transferase
MGPVTPLLAIVEAWRAHDPNVEFFWIGTPRGPERSVVSAYGVRFVSLPVVRFCYRLRL